MKDNKRTIGWTTIHENALQAVYEQMRAAGIPCERAGKPNVTAIIQYALEQQAKVGNEEVEPKRVKRGVPVVLTPEQRAALEQMAKAGKQSK